MFEAQKSGKKKTTVEESRLLARQDNRENQDPIHETIVLEMDMVDDEESGGE